MSMKPFTVWVELPRGGLTQEQCEQHADLASKMMHRLGCPADYCFEFVDGKYTWGNGMGCSVLTDNGYWFNLAFLAGGVDGA